MALRAEVGAANRRLSPRPKTNANYEDTASHPLQRLIQIGDDVFDVFDAHGQPHQAAGEDRVGHGQGAGRWGQVLKTLLAAPYEMRRRVTGSGE